MLSQFSYIEVESQSLGQSQFCALSSIEFELTLFQTDYASLMMSSSVELFQEYSIRIIQTVAHIHGSLIFRLLGNTHSIQNFDYVPFILIFFLLKNGIWLSNLKILTTSNTAGPKQLLQKM